MAAAGVSSSARSSSNDSSSRIPSSQGAARRTELVYARRGRGAVALQHQRLRLLPVLLRAQRGGMQRPDLALVVAGKPVGDLHVE